MSESLITENKITFTLEENESIDFSNIEFCEDSFSSNNKEITPEIVAEIKNIISDWSE